ncbi:hypothetical protein [Sphingomonas sp.]|uniref:hypothetical protein n=1 Tax=Sphingomonas sp. TaxID=28214 RepID=UPI0025EF9A87|nr:hypothetical protein [Sphingomonas sp.]
MLAFVRIANWTGGALVVLTALVFLLFLPENIADYAREPEDVWLSVWWIGGRCLLAALCFVNAIRARKAETLVVNWLIAVNVVVLVGLVTLKALDTAYGSYDDPLLTLVVALCALGPASAVFSSLQTSLAKRH